MSRNAAMFTSQKKLLSFPTLLDEIQEYMSFNYRELMSSLDNKNGTQFRSYIQQYLTEKEYGVEGYDFGQLVEKLYDEMAGFSFLSQYIDMRVPGVEEVNINAWDDVEVHFSGGRVEPADGQFYSPLHATNVVKRILSKSGIILDGAHPCVRGHLNKNIRVTVNGPGVIDDDIGIQASIRFVNPQKLGKDAFLKNGLSTEEMLDFLVTLYRHGVSMCLAGPTGAGKTTLMAIEYKEIDGLLYPQLEIAAPEDQESLTKYGIKFKKYLKEEQPARYAVLMGELEVMKVCHQVEREANEYEDEMLKQLRKEHPAPKTDNHMELIQYNNWLYKTAEEMTLENILYTKI